MRNYVLERILSLLLISMAVFAPVAAEEEEEEEEEKTEEQLEFEKQEALEERLAAESEIKTQFEYSFNEIADKVVTISCESKYGRSSGSGFIANMDGKPYLLTNQHVILGADKISFKTASGKSLRPRGIELSVSRDIARLSLPEDHEGFEITGTMSIGSPIGVFGNSEGGGVATELYGKIDSVGSEVVDVSADIVSGNSGSPVLNLEQEVIGIASYVQWSHDDEDGSETRHFCYRLTDTRWKRVKWNDYNKRYGKLYSEYNQFIDSIFELVSEWSSHPYSRMTAEDHEDPALRKWAVEHNRMINRIMRLSDKGTATQHELDNTNKQIKKDMRDSADALAAVCKNKARQMRMMSQQRELSGFLKEGFEEFADRLEFADIKIKLLGQILANDDYFHFK
jgi:hypothetical protein